jgi:DnaA family protein
VQQLPLGVRLRAASTFASFAVGENAAAVAALEVRAAGSRGAPLWLWGPSGAGRSHLLQATCVAATRAGRSSAYLPLGSSALLPGQLTGLDALDLVCLDDVGAVLGQGAFELAIFRLYRELQERNAALVIAAAAPPAAFPVALADLASRLRACEVWQLRALPEPLQGGALTARAALLGLELPAETLQYLQRRLPRDFAALCGLLNALDEGALAAQRRLTVPFVREVLEAHGALAATPRGSV